MIELQARREGVVLPLRAQPGARETMIRGEHDGALKVSVTQVAEKGKANQAILRLLSAALGLKKSQLQIVSGSTASRKEVLVRGIDVQSLRRLIDQALSKSHPPR